MSWITSRPMLVPNDGYEVDSISAVVIDKNQIVVGYQHQLNDNCDMDLNMSELHSNTNKYAPLSLKGRPIKYMTNVVPHNDKLYVAVSCWGEETVNLEPDGDSFYLQIFVTTTINRRNEWSCIRKSKLMLGDELDNYSMVAADDYLYIFGEHDNMNRRYNIIKNEWETLQPMPIQKRWIYSDAVRCGKYIFLFFSHIENWQSMIWTTVEVFDITNQQWVTVDKPSSIPCRIFHATVAVNERYIVVIGGINLQSVTLLDSQILDTFTNIWYTSECNMSTKRSNFGATVLNGIDPRLTVIGDHLTMIGGENEVAKDLCSVETISLYQLQPKLLPYWQKELHKYFCTKTKNRVTSILQVLRRGDLPIPKEIFMEHIFAYACSPID